MNHQKENLPVAVFTARDLNANLNLHTQYMYLTGTNTSHWREGGEEGSLNVVKHRNKHSEM